MCLEAHLAEEEKINWHNSCFFSEMTGTCWWYEGYTTVWLKFCIYSFLHKGTIWMYLWYMTAASSRFGVQRLRLDRKVEVKCPVGKNKIKIKATSSREGAPQAPIPRVRRRAREEVCDSSVPLSIPLGLFSWSYHAVGSFLSLRGASSFPSMCLCLFLRYRLQDTMMMRRRTTQAIPPPMANARRRSSENEAVVTTRSRISPTVPWTSGGFLTWQMYVPL